MQLDLNFTVEKIHPKIVESNKQLYYKFPYYSDILFQTNFMETKEISTAGVNVSTKGMNYYYNPDFIDSLNPKEVNFINLHEIFHLLFNHPNRGKNKNRRIANIAQDMIINTLLIEQINKDFIEIPKDKKSERDTALFVPKEYKGELIFEKLYKFLMEKKEEFDQQDQNDDDDNKSGKDKEDNKNQKDSYGPNGKNGEMQPSLKDILKEDSKITDSEGNTIDVHIKDDIPQEIRDQIIRDVIERIKARGLNKDEFEVVLNKLRKSKKNYLREIKSDLEILLGKNKYHTWTRINRKGLPTKGYKKVGMKINVLLDTSGSMGGYFEKALSYVFNHNIYMNLIQVDTVIQRVKLIKNMRQLKKEKIKGLGGTILQPGLDYIKEKYNKFSNIILSDGYTDSLDFTGIKNKTLILTIGNKCPIKHSNGRVKQIVVEKED